VNITRERWGFWLLLAGLILFLLSDLILGGIFRLIDRPTTAQAPAAAVQPRTFGGYPCTDDCSGHEAGYEWAESREPADEAACENASRSFREGCMAWLADNTPEALRERDAEAADALW